MRNRPYPVLKCSILNNRAVKYAADAMLSNLRERAMVAYETPQAKKARRIAYHVLRAAKRDALRAKRSRQARVP